MAGEQSPARNTPNSANKRMYRRYVVNLKGKCCDAYKKCRAIEVKDFCLGGMFLTYADQSAFGNGITPSIDDIIDIYFVLPLKEPKKLHFKARVVRSDLGSLGVSFTEPNETFLQATLKYSKWYQARNEVKREVTTSSASPGSRQVILENIRNKALNPLHFLIDTYLLRQSKILLELADKSQNISDQNAYFEAIEAFKRKRMPFRKGFIDGMHQIIFSDPEPLSEQTDEDEDISASALTLVEDDAIDDWIARSDITSKSESFYHDELAAIEKRFSLLYGITIGQDNNPIGPAAFSKAFQDAIKMLNLGKSAYLASCKIFRDVLKESLGSLYEDVNNYLVHQGVMSEVHYEIKKSEDTGRPRSRKQKDTGLSVQLESEADAENLYDLISSLQAIRHNHRQQLGDLDYDRLDSLPKYETEELIGRLSDLVKGDSPVVKLAKRDPAHLESITLKLLEELQSNAIDRAVGGREESIMETTGSIYQSMFDDGLITNGTKDWLGEVELPLLKEAIKDDSVLFDRKHIARKFINHLAQLELYNDEKRDVIGHTVKDTIENLLKQVAEQPGMDENLVGMLLAKVDALVRTQDKAYSENLNDVVQLCKEEDELPEIKLSTKISHESSDYLHDSDELREWRKRIRRLKIGSWLLFNADSSESERLRLTWVSDNYDKYVFVNLRGLMEGAIGVDELAFQLKSGAAIVLDNAEEPALDRAQYSMLQKMHSQLLHETTHDQLTGLMNRREFQKQLKLSLVGKSHDINQVLCFFDLDYFDVINSTFGFDAGDKVLVDIGNMFSNVIRDKGLLARVGGNQFIVLLTDSTKQEAIALTDEARRAIADYRFTYEGSNNAITFCAGIVPVDLQRYEIGRLIQTAEAACRLAKSKGINHVQVIDTEGDDLAKEEAIRGWGAKIDSSLQNNTLQLRYQPIVPIGDDGLSPHAEILLGVTDGKGQLTSPEHFILAAERYRRMPEIDRWVIKNVFNYINQNTEKLEEIGGVAINLSGLSINDDSFIPFVIEQLERINIPLSQICFEVTETAGIDNLSNAATFISEVKSLGCLFSLDDFGTGMSSYSYLKNLPVDFIKIDGSFVREIEKNPSDMAVVKSVTEIGHFMGKHIIAECVEKTSTIDLLRDIGVDYVQGYAISKPMPLIK